MALATVGVGAEPGARVSKGPGARPRSSGARQFAKALPFIGPSMVGVALFLVVPVIFVFVL